MDKAPFTKHDAIRLWVAEHHPDLKVRIHTQEGRLGFIVIGRDMDFLQRLGDAGDVVDYGRIAVVEINFDVHKGHHDWFYNHNHKSNGSPAHLIVSIKDPSYFDKLADVLRCAKLI